MAAGRPNSGSRVKTDNKCNGKLDAKTILHTEEDYYPGDNRKNCFREIILSLETRQRTGEPESYGISFFSASFVWRSWESVKPAASTTARLCLWFWTYTQNFKGDIFTAWHWLRVRNKNRIQFYRNKGGQTLWVYLYTVCQSRYYSLGHKFVFHNICWT